MNEFNVLLVEDAKEDILSFKDTVERLNDQQKDYKICYKLANSFDAALDMIERNECIQAAIVDIKIEGPKTGNELIEMIQVHFRFPVAIMTATPDTKQKPGSPIIVYKKSEAEYEDILKRLYDVVQTGLLEVLGRSGALEEIMADVFWKHLYPKIDEWVKLNKAGEDTEKILLRYAIAHITERIDCDIEKYATPEMYISPVLNKQLKTGSIIKRTDSGKFFIVLSPSCDLVPRANGSIGTEFVLLCEVDNMGDFCKKRFGTKGESAKRNILLNIVKNKVGGHLHWLPEDSYFPGGVIDFQKVVSCSIENIVEKYTSPIVQIQGYFVKDIQSRFAAYYARQGQPDIDFDREAGRLYEVHGS